MQELLQLPLQVQATLVAGYLGYVVYKRDHRKTEKLSDMWMIILLLGLPTAFTLQLCDSAWAYAVVPSGLVMALIWLKFIEAKWNKLLHSQKVSNKLNEGDVWKTMSSHRGVAVTQISLTLKDGSCYLCEDPTKFEDEPFAPFIMDEDGIAFYVTDIQGADDSDWNPIEDVQSEDDNGSLLTYFPRNDIKLLEFRFLNI